MKLRTQFSGLTVQWNTVLPSRLRTSSFQAIKYAGNDNRKTHEEKWVRIKAVDHYPPVAVCRQQSKHVCFLRSYSANCIYSWNGKLQKFLKWPVHFTDRQANCFLCSIIVFLHTSMAYSHSTVMFGETVYCITLWLLCCMLNTASSYFGCLIWTELTSTVTLGDLLMFIMGADSIPPLGFPHPITIMFYDMESARHYPTASTCDLHVRLPRGIQDPNVLQELMENAVLGAHGFGKCWHHVHVFWHHVRPQRHLKVCLLATVGVGYN